MTTLMVMGRPRGFEEETVLTAAAEVFVAGGYEGTSIDDLVKALDVHRGSLYKAFGSKRGLFLAVLGHYVETLLPKAIQAAAADGADEDGFAVLAHQNDLDLLLVAALERGHHDAQVAALVRQSLVLLDCAVGDLAGPEPAAVPSPRPGRAMDLLAARLYERLHDEPAANDARHHPTAKET